MDTTGVIPLFFPTRSEFRKWLSKNHNSKKELWVGFKKISSGEKSILWTESVEEAICFGWIDGLRKSIDEKSYMIRFTPRKENSIWSAVNIRIVEKLKAEKKMMPSGLKAYEHKKEDRSGIYSFEQEHISLPPEYEALLKKDAKAWKYFCALPPSTLRASVWWVTSAKREETRLRRLEILKSCSSQGQKIPQFVVSKKSGN